MKIVLVILFLTTLNTYAQDCQLKDEKDRYNQGTTITTGFKSIGVGSDKFLFSVSADKTEVDIFFVLEKSALCFNEFSRAMIQFEKRQKGSFRNGGTTNCKGFFHFIFPNQQNLNPNLNNLSFKKIENIQFTGNENEKKIITIQPKDQSIILESVACILSELEKLRVDTWKPHR